MEVKAPDRKAAFIAWHETARVWEWQQRAEAFLGIRNLSTQEEPVDTQGYEATQIRRHSPQPASSAIGQHDPRAGRVTPVELPALERIDNALGVTIAGLAEGVGRLQRLGDRAFGSRDGGAASEGPGARPNNDGALHAIDVKFDVIGRLIIELHERVTRLEAL